MKKQLLTTVLALGSLAVAWAAPTPTEVGVRVSYGNDAEALAQFNLKFVQVGTDDYLDVPFQNGTVLDETKKPTLTLGDASYTVATVTPGMKSLVNCTVSPAITSAGVYTINVPEGFISWGDGEYCNKAVSTTINVVGGALTQDEFVRLGVGISPNPEEDQTSMRRITLGAVGNVTFGASSMWSAGASMTGVKASMQPNLSEDHKSMWFDIPFELNEPGEYVFSIIPKVFVVNKGGVPTENPQITYTFKIVEGGGTAIVEPVDVTVESSPLNASTSADSFSKFAILVKTDGQAVADALTVNAAKVASVKVSGTNGNFVPSAVNVASEASTIELEFASPVNVAGTYSITLPEGLVEWNGKTNKEVTLTDAFTVTGEVSSVFSDITWRNGQYYAYATEFNADMTSAVGLHTLFGTFVNIPEGETLEVPSPYDENDNIRPDAKRFTCVTPEGKEITGFIYSVMNSGVPVPNAFRITLATTSSYVTIPGEYKLTIPAGAMSVNGFSNPEIHQSFFVKDDRYYEPVDLGIKADPDPVLPRENLSYVSFRFNNNGASETDKLYTTKGVAYGAKVKCQKVGTDEVTETLLKSDTFVPTSLLAFEAVFESRITAPGQYIITLPAGSINLQRNSDSKLVTNTEFTVTYTIEEGEVPENAIDVRVPVNPSDSEKVNTLNKFEFSAPVGYSIYLSEPTKAFEFKTPDGKTELVHPYEIGNVLGDYVFLELPQTYNQAGVYTLTVPVGALMFMDSQENVYVNKEIVYTYTLEPAEEAELEWTATPANGNVVYSMMQIYVTFAEKVASNATGVKAEVTTDAATTNTTATVSFSAANNRLMVDMMPYIGKCGEYEIVIPAAVVKTDDGRVNKPIVLHYAYETTQVDSELKLVCSPKEGKTSDLSNVTVSAPEGWVAMRATDSGATKVFFRLNENEPQSVSVSQTTDATYRIRLEDISLVKGDYELTVPEKTFIVSAENGRQAYNPTQTFFWMYDPEEGVSVIASENGLYTVFTLDGNCVMRDVDADQLRTLENGIYIINGIKVVRR